MDADLTEFTDEDMARLDRAQQGVARRSDTSSDDAVRMRSAPRMACHRDQPDGPHPFRLCAGWLATVGPHHMPVRMNLIEGTLPLEAVYPDTRSWPELHASLEDLLTCRDQQMNAPSLHRSDQTMTHQEE
ncbi:hypothetical protein J2853_009690 [Streptosporangium lutulentum]|uniref:Uncharacterized protein n=1 Tax=Streptosporangium lutulentum TaxID=1461250 RepID=A0ABT9QUH0_9ACTN|nr:hypothetical protein [Streptosporangium lutulentum]